MKTPLFAAQLLLLEGADAVAFANAQFTADVTTIPAGSWRWCGWLDAQGRTQHFFALLRTRADALLLWQPLGDAEAMRAALTRFVFRAKVSLRTLHEWVVWSIEAGTSSPHPDAQAIRFEDDGYAIALPGDARIAWLAPGNVEHFDAAAAARWRHADVAAGLPLIETRTRGVFVPQALDLERIDAISFGKGCYPGQEIAARLHFRGGNKRRLRALRAGARLEAVEPGHSIVSMEGAAKGTVLYATCDALLAVVVDGEDTAPAYVDDASARIDLSTMPFVD